MAKEQNGRNGYMAKWQKIEPKAMPAEILAKAKAAGKAMAELKAILEASMPVSDGEAEAVVGKGTQGDDLVRRFSLKGVQPTGDGITFNLFDAPEDKAPATPKAAVVNVAKLFVPVAGKGFKPKK